MVALIPEFEYTVDVAPPQDVGAGPFGHRMSIPVPGGELVGERLKGSFVGAAGDWILIGPDGYGRLDVRGTLETVDGAYIFFQYSGLLEMTPAVMAILGGGETPTDFGDQHFFTNPRLETGDDRYAWVNRTFFVGEGRLLAGPRVNYKVFRLEHA
jgi:hypothetical protein